MRGGVCPWALYVALHQNGANQMQNVSDLKKPVKSKPLPKASVGAKPKSGSAGVVRVVRPPSVRGGR